MGTLPGHEKINWLAAENDVGTWLMYSDFLIDIAHKYGKKVIVVGQSTGANLALRAFGKSKIDGLILFQPFFGLNKLVESTIAVAQNIPDRFLNFRFGKYNLSEALKLGIEDQRLLQLPYTSIPPEVPVTMYVADFDTVVSTKASLEWAARYAPHSTIKHHYRGHMSTVAPD